VEAKPYRLRTILKLMMRGQGGGVVGREAGWWSDTKILTYCGASSLAKARIVTQ